MSNEVKTPEKKEKKTINIPQHMAFESNVKSMYTNTMQLAEQIDSLFSPIFHDYYGCKIQMNRGDVTAQYGLGPNEIPLNRFYVNLYFKDRGEASGKTIKNVLRRSEVSASKSQYRQLLNLMQASGRMYTVTEDTYEALDEFRFFPSRNVKWDNLTQEVVNRFGYGNLNEECIVCITGLSLESIIAKMYGITDDDADETDNNSAIYQYQIAPVNLVMNNSNEYVLLITQLDVTTLSSLRSAVGGPVISDAGIHVCTHR